MDIIVKTYNIFIDSANRTSGSETDFTLHLQSPICLENPMNFFRIKIMSFECPYSFKSINHTNNVLYVRIVRSAENKYGYITIPSGNYNILSVLAILKTKIIAFYELQFGMSPEFVLQFTYNKDTGQSVLNIIGDSVATTITLYWSENTTLGKFFGFTLDTTLRYNGDNVVTSVNYISNVNVNCSPITAIYLRSNNLIQMHNYENIVDPSVQLSDILQKVQIITPPGSYIFYSGENSIDVDINNNSIDSLNITLTDNLNDTPLDLNGLTFTFRILINEIKPSYEQLSAEANATETVPVDNELEMRISELEKIRDETLNELENLKEDVYK